MLPDNEDLFSNYFTLRSVTENTKNVYLATLKKWDEVTGIPLHDLDEKTPGPVVPGLSTFFNKQYNCKSYYSLFVNSYKEFNP